jgi:hypothetical protein
MKRLYVIQWKDSGYTKQYIAENIEEVQRIIGSFLETDEDGKILVDYTIRTHYLDDYIGG